MAEVQNGQHENKMGVMPVNRLLITISVPMMISMLVQALYNIVDSMFVARLSEEALTAVSLAFPVQNLMIAVGAGTGVGVNALASRALGEKDMKTTWKTVNNGIWLALFSGIAFAILSFFLAGPFFRVQTDVSRILTYGEDYVHVIGTFSVCLFSQMMFERLLQSTGNTVYSMISQMTGAIINIILDPIMIFGLLGFPRLEVTGAALATVIGQLCGTMVGVFLNLKKNKELQISLIRFKPDLAIIRRIYSVGIPSIVMASVGSIMTFGMNKILLVYTTTATAVFGVYFKLQSFVFMPVFGLNNGMIPIVAYNFGARKPDRITKTVRLSMLYGIIIMGIGTLVFELIPEKLLSIFNASENMMEIGVPALRIIAICFVMAAFSIVCVSLFQALGHGMLSLITSVLRQLGVLLPSAWILSKTGGLSAVWWAFPIAELAALILSALFLRKIYRSEIKPLYSYTAAPEEP